MIVNSEYRNITYWFILVEYAQFSKIIFPVRKFTGNINLEQNLAPSASLWPITSWFIQPIVLKLWINLLYLAANLAQVFLLTCA